MIQMIAGLFNYWASVALVLFGFYCMMTKLNLIRKVIGMTILQTGVILFFLSLAVKRHAQIPVLSSGEIHGQLIQPEHYSNPLPHALMLTAIVVGVSTLGLALVLLVSIYRSYQTLEENEILQKMEKQP